MYEFPLRLPPPHQNIPDCSPVVYNTLLEVYLSKDACRTLTEEEQVERVMRLLRSSEGGQVSSRGPDCGGMSPLYAALVCHPHPIIPCHPSSLPLNPNPS